jgi:hypothetical protein
MNFYIDGQTCGRFPKCNRGNISRTQTIIVAITLSLTVLIAICSIYFRYRYFKIIHMRRTRNLTAENNTSTSADPYEQIYTISTSPGRAMNREEPPPTYEMSVASSTTTKSDLVIDR